LQIQDLLISGHCHYISRKTSSYMIRVLSIVRELAMIMFKRFWLFYNEIFKIGYAGRIIDKAHMYEAVSRRSCMIDLYGYCISIWLDGNSVLYKIGLFRGHDLH